MMVEKVRDAWQIIPDWVKIFLMFVVFIWKTADWHREVIDQLTTQEDQIKEIQQYMRTDHDHRHGEDQPPPISSKKQQPSTDADIPSNYPR
jgi:hypothetical protein